MKYAKLFAALVVLAVFAVWASPAHAQSPSITVDPPTVEAAGLAEFTVSGSGYPAGETIFVLTCPGAEGDPDAVNSDTATTMCDIGGMSQATAGDDGTFSTTITGDVTDDGLVILASTSGSGDSASQVVTISEGPEPTPEPTETPTEATPTETPTETATTTEMPATGGESGMLAIVGVSIVIAGFLFVSMGRRLGRV